MKFFFFNNNRNQMLKSFLILFRLFLLSGIFHAEIFAQPDIQQNKFKIAGYNVEVTGDFQNFKLDVKIEEIEKDLVHAIFRLTSNQYEFPPEFSIKWSFPYIDIAGQWKTGSNADMSVPPDWTNSRNVTSFVTYHAPVMSLFGYENKNKLTYACSDALNTLVIKCGVREEDARVYNVVKFFTEKPAKLQEYEVIVRFDKREIPYYTALNDVSKWWASLDGFKPANVPDEAKLPMYSTWYSYHQSVNEEKLLEECKIAKQFGGRSIIIDDGWQTLDTNRGYAYTGDWKPERMTKMKEFVDSVHALDMKVMLWYSVPFVGENSESYERFKDKFLRYHEGDKWGRLDPRFPEVREFIINTYLQALKDWNLDGFKLDFIDQFRVYEGTVLEAVEGRDISSVYVAVDKLMTDIMTELTKINPEILIEFRQNYIGPLMRKYGNMFRASDCPNSAFLNRHRTTQVKLLCDNTAVHADMIMWNYEEPVELAAMQYTNIMFSVPQISVQLKEIPSDHLKMLQFLTRYWIENREILLDGEFAALNPEAGYPILISTGEKKLIAGVYDNLVLDMEKFPFDNLDIINGKATDYIALKVPADFDANVRLFNCLGEEMSNGRIQFNKGINQLNVPMSGIVKIEKENK
jgi:alpha-galactosidase